jgi:predicted dienelactone hydrolase
MDVSKVGVVGHSVGGHTASLLLGARPTDSRSGETHRTPRQGRRAARRAGRGGDALSEAAAENYFFFTTTDFTEMTTPALVVAGAPDPPRTGPCAAPDGTPTPTSSPALSRLTARNPGHTGASTRPGALQTAIT